MNKQKSKRRASDLNRLIKSQLSETEQKQLQQPNNELRETMNRLKRICMSLSFPTEKYNPEKTVSSISDLLASNNRLPRILYSYFSNYIFSLSEEEKGIFDTNVVNLLQHATNANINQEVKDFSIRIYDHCQLAKAQTENIDRRLEERIANAQSQITAEAKKLEKEYISILGIFASVVLSFTAGIVFSSSVLDNIANASIYRTIAICVLIGLVLMNLLFVLFHFIGVLVHENAKMKKWPMLIANGVLIGILLILFFFWECGSVEKRNQAIERDLTNVSSVLEFTAPTKPDYTETHTFSSDSLEIIEPLTPAPSASETGTNRITSSMTDAN